MFLSTMFAAFEHACAYTWWTNLNWTKYSLVKAASYCNLRVIGRCAHFNVKLHFQFSPGLNFSYQNWKIGRLDYCQDLISLCTVVECQWSLDQLVAPLLVNNLPCRVWCHKSLIPFSPRSMATYAQKYSPYPHSPDGSFDSRWNCKLSLVRWGFNSNQQ